MPNPPEKTAPATDQSTSTEQDYPRVCGTMLLYAGLIQALPDEFLTADQASENEEPEAPRFI